MLANARSYSSVERGTMTAISETATAGPRTDSAGITSVDSQQVERANTAARTPVVFVHGLWLLPGSWKRWERLFEEAGYTALAPGWPDDPPTVEEANARPDVFAHKTVKKVADHIAQIILGLSKKPILVGHSMGGLVVQILAARGLSRATVAIDPAPFRGVLPLPLSSLKAAWPVIRNPANRGRAVALSFDQFRYAFANAVDDQEARELYKAFAVPASGAPLFQAAVANLNPWTELKVDTKSPQRGPLLILSGERDHAVPRAMVKAAFHCQKRNPGVTEILEVRNRGHSMTIDSGWQEVADAALEFARRFG